MGRAGLVYFNYDDSPAGIEVLHHHYYSEAVFEAVVINKDVKNLLSPRATRDLIPNGNEEVVNLIEKQVTTRLGNKDFCYD